LGEALCDIGRRRRRGALLLLVVIGLGLLLFLVAAHLTFCHGILPCSVSDPTLRLVRAKLNIFGRLAAARAALPACGRRPDRASEARHPPRLAAAATPPAPATAATPAREAPS